MHIKQDVKLLAIIQLFIAALMCVPFLIGAYYHELPAVHAFALTIVLMLLINLTVVLVFRKEKLDSFNIRDGFFFVSFTWLIGTAFGALPLYFSPDNFSTYSAAYFEIMSGFTTTGATMISNIEDCYKSILFWRSMTNWLGGMGIVVLFVAILPLLGSGAGAFYLFGAESAGPTKDKLTAKTQNTALVLWGIYFGMTILQTVLLMFGGLSLYDAITVTFSTVSAAGFCVKNASIGAFNSAYVDIICTVFMILAGLNFSLYYKAFTGKAKDLTENKELRAYLLIFAVLSLTAAAELTIKNIYPSFFTSLRYSAFHVASVLTTTGFTTANYLNWPSFALMCIIVTMFIGGCSGSAGGGIKVTRVVTIVDMTKRSVLKKIHPHAISKVRSSDGVYDAETIHSITTFVGTYFMTWILGSLIISISGLPIADCFSSTILTLGNIGIGFSNVGINTTFMAFPAWTRWIFSFLMLVGRLELFTVYVLFSRYFWKR